MPSPWQTTPACPPHDYVQRQVRLARGQVLRLWLPAGAAILSHSTQLVITTPPRYLGEQLSFHSDQLEDGQVLTTTQAGWLELQAPAGGSALCMWPQHAPWTRRLLQGWWRLLGRPARDATT